MNKNHYICPLCSSDKTKYKGMFCKRNFFECKNCELVFLDFSERLSNEEEKKRYDLHENSPDNKGYCDFLNRAIKPLIEVLPENSIGLDYGCGPSPTLSVLMKREGYNVHDYDPIYYPDLSLFEIKYDFITSTEVFEHFYEPTKEIKKILSLLNRGGKLAVMTEIYSAETDFSTWHYIREPSHVVFYSNNTMEWIAANWNMKISNPHKNVRIFSI